jgi:hypothetical protein
MSASRPSTTAYPLAGSALLGTETTISSGPLRTSGSVSSSRSSSPSRPAMCTSHTTSSSIPTILKSCDGRRRSTLTGISQRTRTRVVNLVASSLPRGQAFRRRWGLPPLRDPRLTATDRGPRRYGLPAEPTCPPVSGRHIVDSISLSKKVGRLSAGCRATCLRPGRVNLTGWGPQQNRNYLSPAYETLSSGGGLAPTQRRVATDTNLYILLHFVHILRDPALFPVIQFTISLSDAILS